MGFQPCGHGLAHVTRIMWARTRTRKGGHGGGRTACVHVTLTVKGEMQVGDTSRPFCLCCSVFGFV